VLAAIPRFAGVAASSLNCNICRLIDASALDCIQKPPEYQAIQLSFFMVEKAENGGFKVIFAATIQAS
jgi:hypothetical protein